MLGFLVATLPKEIWGGLGFIYLSLFNEALLVKNGWKMLYNPSSLSALILKSKYIPNSTFVQAKKGSKPFIH